MQRVIKRESTPLTVLWVKFSLDSFFPKIWIQKYAKNPGRDTYKPLWKFLPNLLTFSIFFSNSTVDRKVDFWKNFRADFIYLRFNLHQWLVYKTSVISTTHVTIQGTCWKWNYLSRFYCEEIMNKDFDEDKRKLPTKSFLKYWRELSTYP